MNYNLITIRETGLYIRKCNRSLGDCTDRCNVSGFLYRVYNLRRENPLKLHMYKQHKREIRRLKYCFQILKLIIFIND